MTDLSTLLRTGTAALVLGVSAQANAALVTATWTGVTDFAEAGNAYGLQAGDLVSGFAQFDTDWLVQPFLPDAEIWVVQHNLDPSFEINVTMGSRTFDISDQAPDALNPITPSLGWADPDDLNGSFVGVSMDTCQSVFFDCVSSDGLGFGTFFADWELLDDGVIVATGTWTLDSIQIQPVPVPAAFPLMLTALGGLFGLRRRSR